MRGPAMSASDGELPTLAASSWVSLRVLSQRCTARLGRVPSDLRPVAPLRTICTKLRTILPLSQTR